MFLMYKALHVQADTVWTVREQRSSPELLDHLQELLRLQGGLCAATGIEMQWWKGCDPARSISIAKVDAKRPREAGNVALVCSWVSNIANIVGLSKLRHFTEMWVENFHLCGEPGRCALTGVPLSDPTDPRWTRPSLDRIDNSLSHDVKSNLRETCLWANLAKGPCSDYEFYWWLNAIWCYQS